MRKYDCFGTASFLDGNLRKINSFQTKIDVAIQEGIFKFHGLRQRLSFYYHMMHMKKTIELARKGDHISLKDYYKLVDLWLKIFSRTYRIAQII